MSHPDIDDASLDAVLAASRALVGIAARSLDEVSDDISLAQLRVLVLLDGLGPRAMGELADRLGVNPSTVTRVCDVLVAKELIERGASDLDRRTVRAGLTDRGHALVEQVASRRRVLIADVLTALPADARRRVAQSMAELARAAGELSDEAWSLGWSVE